MYTPCRRPRCDIYLERRCLSHRQAHEARPQLPLPLWHTQGNTPPSNYTYINAHIYTHIIIYIRYNYIIIIYPLILPYTLLMLYIQVASNVLEKMFGAFPETAVIMAKDEGILLLMSYIHAYIHTYIHTYIYLYIHTLL